MAYRMWSRAVLAGLLCLAATQVVASPTATEIDRNADTRALIWQLTADRAIAVASERRLAYEQQEALNQRLTAKDRELRAAQARAAGNAAKVARLRAARDDIARQREELVTALAVRDQMLAAEVRAYREVMTGFATLADPRRQKALQRFADGEQREAIEDLDAILDAEAAAQIKAAKIADAARRRPVAALALQAHDVGKVTLEEVVERFEKVTRLDPGRTWDWIVLARLYDEQGRLSQARRAAQSAHLSVAGGGERARLGALTERGHLEVKAGDLKDAKARFEEALVVARKIAAANPGSSKARRDLSLSIMKVGEVAILAGDLKDAKARFDEGLALRRKLATGNPSADALRDLSICLGMLGVVAVQAGDLNDANARFEEGLVIFRELARANPSSAKAQDDLRISLVWLGDVADKAGDLKDAKVRFEEGMVIARKLVTANPSSANAQSGLSTSLARLGGVAVQAGDLEGAKARFEEAMVIARKLATGNPSSAEAQRNLSVGLGMLGDLAVKAGDLKDAKVRFEERLVIARKLATANPTSAQAQRDLIVALYGLGAATRERKLLREALEIASALDRSGRLAPSDRSMLDKLRTAIEEISQ